MDLAIATMDRLDIGSALLSVSAPERHFGDDTVTRELARQVNEAGAKRHARLPALADVDGDELPTQSPSFDTRSID